MAGDLFDFDPSRMRGSPPPPPTPPPPPSPPSQNQPASGKRDNPITVSALAALISGALADNLPRPIKVVGEISGHRDRSHWYFDLKDEDAIINCVMFASAARKVSFPVENGLKVVATGRLDFFAPQGKAQLYVDRLSPIGAGELELRFRQLIADLKELGWFDPANKQPLPAFPKRIAIVTSRSAAALQDVIDTARKRCPMVELALVDVRVQGEQAAPEIARALRWLSANHATLNIDAIILTRGGGSMEDLWAFNERIVAHAIHDCPIPIVAAIGHETDTTIAELVADERAATPTQAAMHLIPDRAALLEQTDATAARLSTEIRRLLRYETQRIRSLARLPWLADPRAIITDHRAHLAHHARHLQSALHQHLQRQRLALTELSVRIARSRPEAVYALRHARLHTIEQRLSRALRSDHRRLALDNAQASLNDAITEAFASRKNFLNTLHRELRFCGPANILKRGYSITTRADGSILRSINETTPGETITTLLADGSIASTINDTQPSASPSDAPSPPLPPRRSQRQRKRHRDNPGQFGLFSN